MNNFINQVPYLRTSREFPEEMHQLTVEVNKSYVDIANAVNNRTISLFPSNRSAITGESWFLQNNQRQQTFRKVYTFGAIAAGTELDIPYEITNFQTFTRIYGTVITNIPDYRPLPYIDATNLTTSITLLVGIGLVPPYVGVPVIRIFNGVTAPPILSGLVVLEWLSEV